MAPTGGRLWRFRYRYGGKEKLLTLGGYPDVPLKRAREKRDEARRLVADGTDPSVQRQADKATLGNTFEVVAREWLKLLFTGARACTCVRIAAWQGAESITTVRYDPVKSHTIPSGSF